MSADGSASSVPYTNTTTEFDDILIDKGIITKEQALLAHGMDPDQVAEILVKERLTDLGFFEEPDVVEPTKKDLITVIGTANAEALDELEEDDEFCDESFLQKFRQQRMDELKASRATEVFGSVAEITKADWVREVNEASQQAWVLVLLYADHVESCEVLRLHLTTLAPKIRAVKCLTIPARSAVENFPDAKLPALFAYRDGELQHQLITLDGPLYGLRCREQDVEWWLAGKGIIKTDLDGTPKPPTSSLTVLRGASVGVGADSSSGASSPGGGTSYSSSASSSAGGGGGSFVSSGDRRGGGGRGGGGLEENDDEDIDEYTNGERGW